MISVHFKDGYSSGYGVAGTNIYKIVSSKYSGCLSNKNISRGVNIFVKIPPFRIEKGAYNIGFFYWEAVGFPDSWIPFILSLNEFWSSCQLITDNLKMIGFKGKIVNVPTPVKMNSDPRDVGFKDLYGQKMSETFKFYSIFQWNYRKGYDVLIKAFLSEFSDADDACLIVKTNPIDGSPKKEFIKICGDNKSALGKRSYGRIFFSDEKIPYEDISKIHSSCDCFVLPHRGEGWGIPIHEALNSCKPVITTKFGGITDYLNDSNSYLVDYSLEKVKNMEWSPLYDGKVWAEPSVDSLMFKMRQAYEGIDFERKKIAGKIVSRDLSYKSIGSIIKDRLEVIFEGS